MKNLLSIEKATKTELEEILAATGPIKKSRGHHKELPLTGQTWAMIFSKSSTRTRVSFEVAVRELGGQVMFLNANDIQLGRGEPIKDTARVLGRMVHGAIIRTYAQQDVEDFADFSKIPTINALTDDEHPCQILTDIFTFEEKLGSIKGKVVGMIGDGASNMAYSWIFAAAKLGFEFRIASPKEYWPSADILKRAGGKIVVTEDIEAAARGADMIYTDVWVSMGKEAETAIRSKIFKNYKVDDGVMRLAKPNALLMHCLPAHKGYEIDEATFEAHAQTIFDEAENRLHCQKAILAWSVKK